MRALVILLLALCVFCSGGCTSCKDVSNDPKYLGSLKIGATYQLGVSVFYYDFNQDRLFFDHYACVPGFWLLPEQFDPFPSSTYMKTPSLREFESGQTTAGVKGIVAVGTELIFIKVIYYDYFEDTALYYVFRISDGPFSGKEVCVNYLMLQGEYHDPQPILDPKIFKGAQPNITIPTAIIP
jgi:hypothetical protein